MFSSNEELVRHLEEMGVIKSQTIKNAFLRVDRKNFVPSPYSSLAYYDTALPIKNDSTISQPYVIAIMLKMLSLKGKENVLEIGTGSGYSTALLSHLIPKGKITSIEIDPEVYSIATKNLVGYKNVLLLNSDGKRGYELNSPYDRIIVNAASDVEDEWLHQLKDDGYLVLPLKSGPCQTLVKLNKKAELVERGIGVVFVNIK